MFDQIMRMIDSEIVVRVEKGEVRVVNFPGKSLARMMKNRYGSTIALAHILGIRSDAAYNYLSGWGPRSIRFPEFFVAEFAFLLNILMTSEQQYNFSVRDSVFLDKLIKNTWFKDTLVDVTSAVDLEVLKKLKRQPFDFQLEFIRDVYWQKKTQYHLKGYLLAFDQGMGKSTTSLVLKECLHRKHAIIVAPLSVSRNVWPVEIANTVGDASQWNSKDDVSSLNGDIDYVVINYDSIGKLTPLLLKYFKGVDTMLIVDECHNFKDIDAKRTKELIALSDKLKFSDILLMSGTPIKALGHECLPILRLLDSYYTPRVEEILKKLYRAKLFLNELLHYRLGLLMYRKMKSEVLKLPEMHEEEMLVSIRGGEKYTTSNVQTLVQEYRQEREVYYQKHYSEYEEIFLNILKYFEDNCKYNLKEYQHYRAELLRVKRKKYTSLSDSALTIQAVNKYEREVIRPALPGPMRKEFDNSKSVYKYVELKILGEVIGNLLNQLRQEMTSKLIGDRVVQTIKSAKKKTILFSSYIDSLKVAEEVCKKAGLKPMVIDGSNSKDVISLLEKFKSDPSINPLIASIQVMSTGHTIVCANTVIFLNVPFRSVDYEQARDRVYRVGQDTDVYVYKLILDTGDSEHNNLSLRMQDILQWSKGQFDAIVDGAETGHADIDDAAVKGLIYRTNTIDEGIFATAKALAESIKRVFKI